MRKTKEEIKELVSDIIDKNYCDFQGTNEANIHSCYDIAELFEQQTKELKDINADLLEALIEIQNDVESWNDLFESDIIRITNAINKATK